jgi:tyrosine-protein kinase Etk/Wzc
MNNRDSLLGVLQVLYRWRKTILKVCLWVLVGSIVFALTLKNFYKATTTFYPASPNLANPELIFGYTAQVTEYFGTDRDLDRLTEIANGNEVVDFMVDRFRLYEHYDIDSSSRQGPFKVREHFLRLYTAQKNKNDAIELSIEDTDPKIAAEMANAAREKVNAIAQRMTKSSQGRLLATFEDNIKRKAADLEQLGDSLRHLQSTYNIYNPGAQGERLSLQLAIAQSEIVRNRARLEILENNRHIPRDTVEYIKANVRAYERERDDLLAIDGDSTTVTLARFNEASPRINIISDLHFQARKQLSFDLERYNQIKSAYNTDIPALHVVEVAEVPLMKSRPRRSILILAALAAAFLFTCVGILVAEAYRDVRWRDVLDAG